MITPRQLEVLADAAIRLGSGTIELTSRANVQLRGITDTATVARMGIDAGLLPSATHERVRNILASPLSGRAGGLADVRPWVTELDRLLQGDPELAGLPGRFLFGIDDGRGDVAGLGADAGVRVGGDGVALLLAGRDTGIRLDPSAAVDALGTVARRFLRRRGTAWRVAELPDPDALLTGYPRAVPPGAVCEPGRAPVGWIGQDDGSVALGAAVPLGVLSARQAQFVAAIGAPVVITPWRSLLVCDLTESVADTALRVLAPLGLVFDGTSRWLEVTSCVGSPGCERSRADVRAEAARTVESGTATGPVHGPVHFVGCERACGRPPDSTVLVATGDGYTTLGRRP